MDKPFDFKKEYKDLYLPGTTPQLLEVPKMNSIMVDGSGDPNANPIFESAVSLLYGLCYTIKMSKMNSSKPSGYFDYVVPPLEGLWWVDNGDFSLDKKDNWVWTLMIRQPDFVNPAVFNGACEQLSLKKPELDTSLSRFEEFYEGLCMQALHIGPYSTETETTAGIDSFISSEGLKYTSGKHHEIYLSDPRRGNPAKLKTVLRHPVIRI
jgi:hypothetical protein